MWTGGADRRADPPTTVNNVQTLSYVPHIIHAGADWFKNIGSERFPGTFVFCISGHVKNPGLFELELGQATMRDLIYDYAGGLYDGRELKAVIPGGSSADNSVRYVMFHDRETKEVVRRLELPGSTAGGTGVRLLAADDLLFFADGALNEISVLDPAAGDSPERIIINTDNPDGMAWSPLRVGVLQDREDLRQ